MRWRGVLQTSLLIPLLSVAAPAALPQRTPTPNLLVTVGKYRQAADAYAAGNLDDAAVVLNAVDRKELTSCLEFMSIPATPETLFRPFWWPTRTLLAAAMLHLDVAVADQRAKRDADFDFHTQIAARLFLVVDQRNLSATGSGTSGFGQRGALAIGLLLLGHEDIRPGMRYLSEAIKRYPNDPQLLLTLGTLTETDVEKAMVDAPMADDLRIKGALAMRTDELRDAAHLFDQALAADPTLMEAQVRLAHVRILQRNDAAAEALLEKALTAKQPAAWEYLSRLMLGGIRDRSGKPAQVVQLYAEAILLQPDGQSAYIAMSAAHFAAGDRAAAADVLARLYARHVTPDTGDPWWKYPFGNARDADAILEGLRVEARRK